MSGKSMMAPYRTITNGNMAANIIGLPSQLEKQDNISFHVVWSGSAIVGRFIVEATNTDPKGSIPATWSELIMDSSTTVPADSGDGWFNIKQFPGTWIRFRYAATSGTGTLNVTLSAKGLG